MSKGSDTTVIVPGRAGWELWSGSPTAGLSLVRETTATQASKIDRLPSSGMMLAFPARMATALPLKTAAEDESLFRDMAQMHVEQTSIRPEEGAGELFDVFALTNASSDGSRLLLPVVLAPPAPGSLPLRGVEKFDLSPRFFAMPENGVAVWEEMGRWVFAIARQGELLSFQALAEAGLGAAAACEINLAIAQLELQGCEPGVTGVTIWHSEGLDTYDVPDEFVAAISVPVFTQAKPRPQIPAQPSCLLPEDVVAARYLRSRRRNMRLAVAATVIAVLSLVGYCGWQFYSMQERVNAAQAKLSSTEGEFALMRLVEGKIDELGTVYEQDRWPVEILSRVALAVPPQARSGNSNFRLTRMEITDGFIVVEGEGQLQWVNRFKESLRKSRKLEGYKWDMPNAVERNKLYTFAWEGTPPWAPSPDDL